MKRRAGMAVRHPVDAARALILLLILCGSLLPGLVQAQQGEPLLREDVLVGAQVNYPTILEALARQREAQGRSQEVAGAYDLVFTGEGFSRLTGFYDGSVVKGRVEQPLRPLGATAFAGYKLSNGTLPIYEDQYYTNELGTVSVGVVFSLLRDRDLDQRRYAELDAGLAARAAEFDVMLARVGVQQQALQTYWRWVAAGRKLRVYTDLLALAEERQEGLREQVERGAQAEIFLTENRQNITRRLILVTSAAREFTMAGYRLGLFVRNVEGRPVPVDERRLPADELITEPPVDTSLDAARLALGERPELRRLATALERVDQRIALAENDLTPQLDLSLEVAEGLGNVAEGGPSRSTTDTIVGVQFSVPLERRSARGRLNQALAEREALESRRQWREEQITQEIQNLRLEHAVARNLVALARIEVEQSESMKSAEQRRFKSGASDFFLVNLREETAANARIQLLDAQLAERLARVSLFAATVDLNGLGLAEESERLE